MRHAVEALWLAIGVFLGYWVGWWRRIWREWRDDMNYITTKRRRISGKKR